MVVALRFPVFGVILAVSFGIALVLALVFGAWLVLPYAGLERVLLYLALRCLD
jgi:uncharacterized membrane protein